MADDAKDKASLELANWAMISEEFGNNLATEADKAGQKLGSADRGAATWLRTLAGIALAAGATLRAIDRME